MRAIIIDDKDARALIDKLKLESMKHDLPGHGVESREAWASLPESVQREIVERTHGKFYYVVYQWLVDQGANVVR